MPAELVTLVQVHVEEAHVEHRTRACFESLADGEDGRVVWARLVETATTVPTVDVRPRAVVAVVLAAWSRLPTLPRQLVPQTREGLVGIGDEAGDVVDRGLHGSTPGSFS